MGCRECRDLADPPLVPANQRALTHRLLFVAAVAVGLLGVHAVSTSGTSAALAGDDTESPAEELPAADHGVVERQVSSDIVVDWLEAPPEGASDWLAAPEAPADHRAVPGHDRGSAAGDVDAAGVTHAQAAGSPTQGGAGRPGYGFQVFSSTSRWLSSGYTIRLVGADARVEEYRDELEAAARGASAAAGLPVRVAPGRGGRSEPARGEITVMVGEGPCGSAAVGCGGPALTARELVSGRVWIYPSGLGLSAADRSNLAAHELGHALGLTHHDADWSDGRQVMYPMLSGLPTYRAGDAAGLGFVAGRNEPPAGTVTERRYAAGRTLVAGKLSSGSRARITVGSAFREVRATKGAFAVAVPSGAGVHQVCVTVPDAAAGFRRHLGCSSVTAPGAPFGGVDAVTNSFQAVHVAGWAIDPQTADAVVVEIRRNGAVVSRAPAAVARPDIDARYGDYGPEHGFSVDVPAVAGVNDLCVRIIGVGAGGDHDLGCRRVHHAVDPVGALELAVTDELGLTVSGWALDPNTASPVQVSVTVDGSVPAAPGRFRAADERPAVSRDHPRHGTTHGFSQRLVLVPGEHEICLTAINVGLGQDRGIGCALVHIDPPGGVDGLVSPTVTGIVERGTDLVGATGLLPG